MNVDVCTSLPITTAMSRLDLRIGVSLPGPLRRAGLPRPEPAASRLSDICVLPLCFRDGLAAVSRFEADHGVFTSEELSDAEQWAVDAVQRSARTGLSTQRRSA